MYSFYEICCFLISLELLFTGKNVCSNVSSKKSDMKAHIFLKGGSSFLSVLHKVQISLTASPNQSQFPEFSSKLNCVIFFHKK